VSARKPKKEGVNEEKEVAGKGHNVRSEKGERSSEEGSGQEGWGGERLDLGHSSGSEGVEEKSRLQPSTAPTPGRTNALKTGRDWRIDVSEREPVNT